MTPLASALVAQLLLVFVGSSMGVVDRNDKTQNLADVTNTKTRHIWGYNNTLLFHCSVRSDVPMAGFSKSEKICFPPKSAARANLIISAINIVDEMPWGQGGVASLQDGGVGKNIVCLYLKSQWGRPYHFVINIWGHYK